MRSITTRFALPSALLIALISMSAATTNRLHMALVRSEPAADSTVTTAPTSLRLYWTQAPKLPVTVTRLTNAANQAVALGSVKADEKDAKILVVPITGAVTPGVYTVTWRTAGDDGHILNGTYKFTFRAAR
jgi:methionine-rich copper-binding protein CopC